MRPSGLRSLLATLVDTPVRGELRIREKALLLADASGGIERILEPGDTDYETTLGSLRAGGRLEELDASTYVLPGLVDLHVHAPQWPQLGKALDVPLEVWLNRYTFPLEARYADLSFARDVYQSLVDGLLANGTTTAVYFGTIHREATQLLVDRCLDQRQRAVVGKVAMDDADSCPDYYRDANAGIAVEETAAFVEYVRRHPGNSSGLVRPAATPRFVPSCTDELLTGLGRLVDELGCLVQTHCSESDWAHTYGLDRFGRTDTETYESFGLLRRGTILAHSNFITDGDMERIAAAGAAVAHCPLSNSYFANAVFPVRRALDAGVHVGLGTDVSGGPSASLLTNATHAVTVSRMLEDGVDATRQPDRRGVADSRLTFAEALWLATIGGGRSLGLSVGVFEPGYRLDAFAVEIGSGSPSLAEWADVDSPADTVQKIITNATPSDITRVWVDGEPVVTSSA